MKRLTWLCLAAHDAHVNYTDTFAQVRLWDVIYNYLRRKNIVLSQTEKSDKKDQNAGAGEEPKPGAYDWVVSLTLTHCILPYSLPEYLSGDSGRT